jgi:dephospho-CoA kinase
MPAPITTPRSLALVGMPGAGKTLCAQYLEQRGYFQFRFGGIIEDEVVRRGLPVIPENERIVREEFRANEGMDAIAKRALPHLKGALETHTSVIIDGLYSFSEYKLLRPELGMDMVVVAIVCPRGLRYERLAARPVRPLTQAQAEARDWQEIEKLEKGGPIAIADHFLLNDSTSEHLLTQLDTLMASLAFQP